MSRRELKSDDEAGFIRAWKDEMFDLANEEHVRLEVTLRAPVREAGLVIYCEALKRDDFGYEQVYAHFSQPYPSHSANRLHAALYRALVRLGVEIRDRRRAEAQENSSAPVDGSE